MALPGVAFILIMFALCVFGSSLDARHGHRYVPTTTAHVAHVER